MGNTIEKTTTEELEALRLIERHGWLAWVSVRAETALRQRGLVRRFYAGNVTTEQGRIVLAREARTDG